MGIRTAGIRAAFLAGAMALTGCVAQFRDHGYVPDDALLGQIVVGLDTRATVEEVVGLPTTGGVLNDSGFYYVETRWRDYGLLEPQVIDRQLVAIRFDANGVVSNVERFTLQDGRVVPLSRRVTDDAIADTSFLRQLMGSLGNFDAAGAIAGSDG